MPNKPTDPTASSEVATADFWETHYQARHLGERPQANPLLIECVAGLPPGRALDLGAGVGGDTLWLAENGWNVTAVDISTTALQQVAEHARTLGLTDQVLTERHDLSFSQPDGHFDLVSAQYFHTSTGTDRRQALRAAAGSVLPGGRMLVVDHGSIAPWSWNRDPDFNFPTPNEVADDLALDPGQWLVERADKPHRQATGPDGQTADVTDHVLMLRRRRS